MPYKNGNVFAVILQLRPYIVIGLFVCIIEMRDLNVNDN